MELIYLEGAGPYALYTAEHKSLAYLECLVHQFERDTWPKNIQIAAVRVEAPENILEIDSSQLPSNWDTLEYHVDSQLIATRYSNSRF